MNSYERVKTAINHKNPDRVPCDFDAVEKVTERLCHYFNISSEKELLKILGIDIRQVGPQYVGPKLRTYGDGSYETIVYGGPVAKKFTHANGVVNECIVSFPWANVEKIEDLAGCYGWNGHMSWWDFSNILSQIDELEEEGKYWIRAHGDPSGLQHLCMWVGDEKFLTLLAMDEDLAMAMIETHNRNRLEYALKVLEAGGGRIHELMGGGDYGMQTGLIISKNMFDRYFKHLYENFYKEIKSNFDVEISFHSCGSIFEFVPELMRLGVTILDPIQTSAKNMEIEGLKQAYGNRMTFHGAIDIQEFLPYATVDEVRSEVRRTISILGKDGGYILAPGHALQTDTPLENILAMYEEAQGRKLIKGGV